RKVVPAVPAVTASSCAALVQPVSWPPREAGPVFWRIGRAMLRTTVRVAAERSGRRVTPRREGSFNQRREPDSRCIMVRAKWAVLGLAAILAAGGTGMMAAS